VSIRVDETHTVSGILQTPDRRGDGASFHAQRRGGTGRHGKDMQGAAAWLDGD